MFIGSAGGPASPTADGWPTYLIPVCASLIYKDSIEVDEQRYPIHVEEQRLLPDTEGAGRFRVGSAIAVPGRRIGPHRGVLAGGAGSSRGCAVASRCCGRRCGRSTPPASGEEAPPWRRWSLRLASGIVSVSAAGPWGSARAQPEAVRHDIEEGRAHRGAARGVDPALSGPAEPYPVAERARGAYARLLREDRRSNRIRGRSSGRRSR